MPAELYQSHRALLHTIWHSLGGAAEAVPAVRFTGNGQLPSAFAVTPLAAAALGAAGLAAAEWRQLLGAATELPPVRVDVNLANAWFGTSYQPVGWTPPSIWDSIAGDYPTVDGWIRLHTNAPRHKRAALAVLGVPEDRATVASAVQTWDAAQLEAAIVEAGGCAAEMRSTDAWRQHPQGRAVAAEPLVHWQKDATVSPRPLPTRVINRPLSGIRVLDLTRVIAGPVATRFLAMLGAEVLRIDPPDWDEPGVLLETTLGKRCTRLDVRRQADQERFIALLADADVLIHGYRPGALEALGFDLARRRAITPRLLDVSLNAYGWTGPWQNRRGFDSLVQMSTGIAAQGQAYFGKDKPTPLPVQALDHATGYIMAAATLRMLTEAYSTGAIIQAQASLARTAELVLAHPSAGPPSTADLVPSLEYQAEQEQSSWGPLRRLQPAVEIQSVRAQWELPATQLGTSNAAWIRDHQPA